MTTQADAGRFEFGKNWSGFVKKNFNEERLNQAKKRLLEFSGLESFDGIDFLDIGCGSGIHSYAALQLGAKRVHGFDYDENSVAATKLLFERAGRPAHWTVSRGDVLDDETIASIGQWTFVYSWGVLHHTGDMWRAIENAQKTVADGGLFYIALYSADADFQPSKEFWLDVKRKYNSVGKLRRLWMVIWYVWRFGMQSDIRRLPEVVRQIITHRFKRGMSYFADVRDWIGGWPMEYAGDQETVDFLEGKFGFELKNVATGEACSEFLFLKTGEKRLKSNVVDIVSKLA